MSTPLKARQQGKITQALVEGKIDERIALARMIKLGTPEDVAQRIIGSMQSIMPPVTQTGGQ